MNTSITEEEFKVLVPERYVVSSQGYVLNIKTGRTVKASSGNLSYSNNGKTVNTRLNTLVASHFIPNPHNYRYVIHKDGNPRNCAVSNLAWAPRAFIHGNTCMVLFDVSGCPHFFRSVADFLKRTDVSASNQQIADLCRGMVESLGDYYSANYMENKINESLTFAEVY